ncbi:MAG: hypothetical protein LBE97_02835 [Holosporales bacterium]|jgi:glucose-6-phosphate isomerase|nr:hypothetical protein [Holosporales bacterium]
MINEYNICDYLKQQINELELFKVVYNDTQYIKDIAKKFDHFDDILIFGTGGSSLGGKCLVNFHSIYTGDKSRVKFIENIDSRNFLNIIGKCNKNKTGIIVISKSGKTTETLMLFLTLCEMWQDFDYKNNAIAITELTTDNDLRTLAEAKEIKILEHNKNIGGRFSVFSIVGLLPAALSGFDIDLLLSGAQNVINEILSSQSFEDCIFLKDIFSMYKVFESRTVNQHVLFAYSDLLEDLGKWYVQLTAESLGKSENFGITPVRAIGTVDQHSLLQLFLGGPSNKLFTFIIQKNNCTTKNILDNNNSNVIKQLKNHNIHQLMLAHQKATIDCLKKKAFVRVLEFDEINYETLGFLMMLSFIDVICMAKFADINPFDQPAVEESKKLAMKYLRISTLMF